MANLNPVVSLANIKKKIAAASDDEDDDRPLKAGATKGGSAAATSPLAPRYSKCFVRLENILQASFAVHI